jgi:hypothetical protein
MDKIGILTFHNASNYGAILQAYALQRVLQSHTSKYTVEIIDYQNVEIDRTKRIYLVMGQPNMKNIVAALLNIPCRWQKEKGIRIFEKKYFNLSQRVNAATISQIKSNYQKVIVGSDQVWNYKLTANDNEYYLPGDYPEKYSYAASMGNDKTFDNTRKQELQDFMKISVREKEAQEFIENNAGIKTEVVCDPTILIETSEWKSLLPERINQDKYILIYSINPDINLMKFAYKIKKAISYHIKYISMNALDRLKIKSVQYEMSPSPEMFLHLISNADIVLTNSFHGTVFSILFKKRFWVETDYIKFQNNRVNDLLTNLGLENRVICDNTEFDQEDIDWDKVDKHLAAMRKTSMQFINSILE